MSTTYGVDQINIGNFNLFVATVFTLTDAPASQAFASSSRFAVRGIVSNGFRVPTLAEGHSSLLNVLPIGAGGVLL